MKSSLQNLMRLVPPILIMVVALGGCSEPPTDTGKQEPKSEGPGFTAKVSGAVNGELSGAGMVAYLPPQERAMPKGIRPGYFLIANLNNLYTNMTEERDFLIALRIPDGTQPGNYTLRSPDPLKAGEVFDVWVETKDEGKFIAYKTNTEGKITLDTFSPDRNHPDTSKIKGTFQFVTENNAGDRISANGTFDFPKDLMVRS